MTFVHRWSHPSVFSLHSSMSAGDKEHDDDVIASFGKENVAMNLAELRKEDNILVALNGYDISLC